jgi:hypothetical protein
MQIRGPGLKVWIRPWLVTQVQPIGGPAPSTAPPTPPGPGPPQVYRYGTHQESIHDAQAVTSQRVFQPIRPSAQVPPFPFTILSSVDLTPALAVSPITVSVFQNPVTSSPAFSFVFAAQDLTPFDVQIAASQLVVNSAAVSFVPTPPPPVVTPPVTGGTVPGFVRGKKKAGPYMREGQVFGEEYAPSPHMGDLKTSSKSRQGKKSKGLKIAEDHSEAIRILMRELL